VIGGFVKRVLLISVFLLIIEALLPDSGTGRFAKATIELMGLSVIILPIKELLL